MKFNIFQALIIIILVFCLAIAISFLQSGGKECLKNPFTYGAKKISKANNGELLSCECNIMGIENKKMTFSSESDIIQYYLDPLGQKSSNNIIIPNISQ